MFAHDRSFARPARGSFMGMSNKSASIITLTFQHSALILLMHYSRMMPPEGDHRYFASTAVFLGEVLKLAASLAFAIYDVSSALAPSTPATVIFEQIYNSVFRGDGWKLAIPAALCTLQNSLHYVAVSNLDAVHFQVLYQAEILATAIFTVTILRRPLGTKRWIALVILTLGVAVISIPSTGTTPLDDKLLFHDTSDHYFPRSSHELGHPAPPPSGDDIPHHLVTRRSATYEGIAEDEASVDGLHPLLYPSEAMSYPLGLAAVLAAAGLSALTGVYFEKVLKDGAAPVGVWTRNIQLSFYSLFPALLVGVMWKDGAEIAKHGFFEGYNGVVWAAVALHAGGGLLSSLVINYADNIAKNFSMSFSILISVVFSLWFFEFELTPTLILGTAMVLFATYLYTTSPPRHHHRTTRPSNIHIAALEKTTIDRLNTPRPEHQEKDPLAEAGAKTVGVGAAAQLQAKAQAQARSDSPSRATLDPMDAARGLGISTSRPASPMFPRSSNRNLKDRDD